jgi:outer membrane protein assembly factor BamB
MWSLMKSPAPAVRGSDGGRPRRVRVRLFLMVMAATMAILAPASTYAATGDWAQFRESQTHQAHNTNMTVISDTNVHALGVIWTGATGAAVNSSPVVANGVVYVGSNDGKLYAFAVGCAHNGGTCTPIWTATTGGAIDSTPAAAGNRVFVGSSDGKLYAFAVGCATGGGSCAPVWTGTTGAPIHSSPAVDGSVVYVGSNDGKLYAFSTTCGTGGASCSPVWKASTGAAIESSPAVANGKVYVGSDDGKLYAFAVGCATGGATCSPLWTATTGGAVHSSPSTLTGVVYVASLDGKLYAFDGAGVTGCSGSPVACTPLWIGVTGGPIYASPTVGDGHVWIGSDDGKVYSFHTGCKTGGATCSPEWIGNIGSPVRSSPGNGHDVLYVGASNGSFYAFDADCATNGSVCPAAYSHSIGTSVLSSPAITNGGVYIGSNDGKLYAFNLVVDHLVLSPATASIVAGAHQAYLAEGFDAGNVDLGDVTPLVTFSMSGAGACTVNACGSTVGGSYTVTGTYGTATGTASLTVSSSGATYVALPPTRYLDTRNGTGGLTGPFAVNLARNFPVAGVGKVPANAVAVTGNLTVTQQSSSGYLYIGPELVNSPLSSNLNFPMHDDRANAVTVQVNPNDGTLAVTFVSTNVRAHAHAIFDVTGYFTPDASGNRYETLDPVRLLDTRSGFGGITGPVGVGSPQKFFVRGLHGVAANAVAVTGNLTVTEQTAPGYLYIGPDKVALPKSSTLNFPLRDDRANSVTVQLNTIDGSLAVTYISTNTHARTQFVFDVTGFFVPGSSGATFVSLPPKRVLDTRNGTGGLTKPFTVEFARKFAMTGHANVPASAVAVTGNLTVTLQSAPGFLYIGPDLTNKPGSSTLNFPMRDDRANAVDVQVNKLDGSLAITFVSTNPAAHTDALFDVTGYFVP